MKTRFEIFLSAYIQMIKTSISGECSHMTPYEIHKLKRTLKEELSYIPGDNTKAIELLMNAQVELVKSQSLRPGDNSLQLAQAHDFVNKLLKSALKKSRKYEEGKIV
jgi:hypothetical protein